MIDLINNRSYYKQYSQCIDYIKHLLEYKYNHDKNFEVDFTDVSSPKYSVIYNLSQEKYEPILTFDSYRLGEVYFSSEKIASSCAKWLNQTYLKPIRRIYDDCENRRCNICKSP